MARIEGKVARVLTVRELIINKGEVDGVRVGMRFAVLNRNAIDITDPDTGESLGSIDVEKTIVKIVRVSEKVSVARTFRTFSIPGSGLYVPSGLAALVGQSPRTEVETLKTDESRLKDEIDESETYVKTGDPVVQVIGDEFSDQDGSS